MLVLVLKRFQDSTVGLAERIPGQLIFYPKKTDANKLIKLGYVKEFIFEK